MAYSEAPEDGLEEDSVDWEDVEGELSVDGLLSAAGS